MNAKSYYRIASFNIKQFSDPSVFHGGSNDSKKDLDSIARIIIDNNIDIIAIQEIRGKLAFRELISTLAYGYAKDITADVLEEPSAEGEQKLITEKQGDDYLACKAGRWEGRWAQPHSKLVTAIGEEGYAFIWNTEKIDLAENERGKVQPVIKHKSEFYFVRPPFYGRFVTKDIGPKFEIAILNTHVLYTANKDIYALRGSGIDYELINSSDKNERLKVKQQLLEVLSPSEVDALERFSNQKDIERRRSEVKNLITEVLEREETKLCRYVFLIGDYNLNISDGTAKFKNTSAIIEDRIVYAKGRAYERTYVIKQTQLSTLKSPPKEEKDPDDEYGKLQGDDRFSNNYDHVAYNYDMRMRDYTTGEMICRDIDISEPVTINALDTYGISNRKYFERISDHLPIVMEIGF